MIKGMSYEGSFTPPQDAEDQLRLAHAGVQPEVAVEQPVRDAAYFLGTFGLGPQETSARVKYKDYEATLGEVLADDTCPLGGFFADAFHEEGLAGVEEIGNMLQRRSKGQFQFGVSNETRAFHAGTLSRDKLLQQPVEARAPDFLARVAIDS